MAFNREQSLILDEQENQKQRIEDLENQVAILKQYRLEADIVRHINDLHGRVTALEVKG